MKLTRTRQIRLGDPGHKAREDRPQGLGRDQNRRAVDLACLEILQGRVGPRQGIALYPGRHMEQRGLIPSRMDVGGNLGLE
ncbi:MAG TPA: hypothetical protein DEB40_13610 [Elusimicrobia bacterium]|nr:hypothetical protein [Elusimicrobiota bacterium]HBT62771.1 hypothetical protein [Elusimicrobiota bacterium]